MADEAFICRQCGRKLAHIDFYVNHKLSVGHEHICKKCESERHKTWLQKSMVIAKRCAKCNKLLGIDYFEKDHKVCCTCEMGW